MATTSPEVKAALETIFAADSDIYQGRGFQRRIGYGTRPALLVIDMANAWTRPNHAFSCDDMDTIIPANQALLTAARASVRGGAGTAFSISQGMGKSPMRSASARTSGCAPPNSARLTTPRPTRLRT